MNTPALHGDSQRCPCMICRAHRANQTRISRTDRKNGKPHRVPAKRSVDHINYLRHLGMSHKAISRVAGLNPTTVSRLLFPIHGRHVENVHRDTEAAILAVKFDLDEIPDRANVLAVGTHRRIQALIAMGWSLPRLATHLGLFPSHLQILERERVLARKARAVRDMYNQLWDKRPELTTRFEKAAFSRTLKWAQSQGFELPAAWDDDTIDYPETKPSTGDGVKRKWEKAPTDEILFLASFGKSPAEIAARLGVSEAQIRFKLQREVAA